MNHSRSHNLAGGPTAVVALLVLGIGLFAAPVRAQQPKAWKPDAVIEQMDVRLRVTPDGRQETRQYRRIRLLSPMAFHQLADPRFLVDREYEELAIEVARVHLPDGSVVDAPSRARTLTTPDAVAQAPSFSQFSEWVVSMVGVEPGSTLELQWVVRDRLKRRDHYEGLYLLGDRFPIDQATVSLELPAHLPLETLAIYPDGSGLPQQQPEHKAATTVYSWKLENIAAQGGLPETAIYRFPVVAFSTAGGWEKLLRPTIARIEEAASGTGRTILGVLEPHGATPQGQERWVALVSGLGNRMRRMPHEVVPAVLPPRDLGEVWRSREATPFEMAQLTVCVLKAAGANARLSLYLPWLGGPGAWPSAMQLVSQYRVEVASEEGPTLRFSPFATEPDPSPTALLGGSVCTLPEAGPITVVPTAVLPRSASQQGTQQRPERVAQDTAVLAGLWVNVRAYVKGGALLMEIQVRGTGAANPWFRWNRLFSEGAAKSALSDLLMQGCKVESVSVRSWGPAGSELVAVASAPLSKGVNLVDLGPLSGWLEPLVQGRLDTSAPPCPNCQVLYSSRVLLEGEGLSLTPPSAAGECLASPSSCTGSTITLLGSGVSVHRELRALLGDEAARRWLRTFLADNRGRGVLVYTP